MGKLDEFVSSVPGYFKTDSENEFPWNANDRSVWFALLTYEDGKIQRYGFTSSKVSKNGLVKALESLKPTDEAILLGIGTGKHRTDLFVLDRSKAINELRKNLELS